MKVDCAAQHVALLTPEVLLRAGLPSGTKVLNLNIIDDLVAIFIASLSAEEVYHAAQARGFTWVRHCECPPDPAWS